MIRSKYKSLFLLCIVIIIFKYSGVFTHLFEKDFYVDFHYPYDGDVRSLVEQLRHNEKPDVQPINMYNYSFIIDCKDKCKVSNQDVSPRLIFLVKSSMDHFDRRAAIRNTWGYEHRFSDVIIRRVFLIGMRGDPDLMESIYAESKKYKDIVQADFIDSYFNNTIKTMMGFKWAMNYCPDAKFYVFSDDDMYQSTKNILRFVRNPTNYPNYLKEPVYSLQNKRVVKRSSLDNFRETKSFKNFLKNNLKLSNEQNNNLHIFNKFNSFFNRKFKRDLAIIEQDSAKADEQSLLDNTIPEQPYRQVKSDVPDWLMKRKMYDKLLEESKIDKMNKQALLKPDVIKPAEHDYMKRQVMDFELPDDVKLFAGYVFLSAPHRHITSKWHVTLEEYPYHMWPPYVTAGSYVLSREALHELYYTSFYTKHLRFDDVYLGLLALKASIEPYHCAEFHFYKKPYDIKGYQFVISSHGYDDPKELVRVWNEQRSSGNA